MAEIYHPPRGDEPDLSVLTQLADPGWESGQLAPAMEQAKGADIRRRFDLLEPGVTNTRMDGAHVAQLTGQELGPVQVVGPVHYTPRSRAHLDPSRMGTYGATATNPAAWDGENDAASPMAGEV